MLYRVEIAPAASGDMKRLSAGATSAIQENIANLAHDPRPWPRSRKVLGRERTYRIRVGDFRVIYEVFDDQHLVVIARVLRHTETTYRRLG